MPILREERHVSTLLYRDATPGLTPGEAHSYLPAMTETYTHSLTHAELLCVCVCVSVCVRLCVWGLFSPYPCLVGSSSPETVVCGG